ncbi:MAG: hypothetical protein HY898_03095 [Deltaproteobacteria bacterium]|nr:hypothetical protein [Deltaproteobacteria bacterium]
MRDIRVALGLSIALASCARSEAASLIHSEAAAPSASLAPSASPAPFASLAPSATPSTAASAISLPPLQDQGGFVAMDVQGQGPAVVSPPAGATDARPIVIALHAHATSARQACENWRRATGPVPFLLCPHGVPSHAPEGAPVTLGSVDQTVREVRAALAALRQKYAEYLAPGPVVIAGYSLGAKVAVGVLSNLASEASLAIWGEGGFDDLTSSVVRGYADHGLRRALLLCRTRACEMSYAPVAKRFEASGVEVRIASAATTGHPFEGKVVETARDAWPWLVRDDPRFGGDP